MFDKLISNLPYNPSLIHQLSFYAKRMRSEASVRRTGFAFLMLAFLIQFFAVISPPKPTVAASNNDLVNGGFRSATQAASYCRNNTQDYGTILANYGISCDKVANAPTITINSRQWNGQLYSMGRLPYNIAGETPVVINGATYYVRYLWGWDSPGTTSTYQALNVTSQGGQTFLLLYNCGNLTSVGMPVPVAKPPVLHLSKAMKTGYAAAGSLVPPGTMLAYRISMDNSGGAANNVVLRDTQPAYTTYKSMAGGATTSSYNTTTHTATWNIASIPANTTGVYFDDVYFMVNSNAPNGTKICNTATLTATGVPTMTSNAVCVTVKVKATPPPVTPPTPPTPVTPTKSCQQAISSEDTIACIVPSKSAANLTQHISNADGTTAQPGDVIVYTLQAKNTGTQDVTGYIFHEDLSDVLDYAQVADLNGGTINSSDQVSWPALTIKAHQVATKQIKVTVDSSIPSTPPSSSDPQHYNLVMTNFYGNYVNIKVPGTPVTTIVATTTTLPNTGPGSSLLIAGGIVILAGYFFARARLLADESTIVMQDNVAGGL
ncbi:MAG TPA: hypothetical protein VFN56_04455 [Candidatus Saccharimonadales bacterium]|nr:hypothetical protein [Candidatus Saccharimonadales bacterium]